MAPNVETLKPPNTPAPRTVPPDRAGKFTAISAVAGIDPLTGELAGSDAYSQAKQILELFRVIVVVDLPNAGALLTMSLTAIAPT
jgi:hypothetical protein